MRLPQRTELRFEEFFDSKILPYAILSHRRGSDEALYQEFIAIRTSHVRIGILTFTQHIIGFLASQSSCVNLAGDLLLSLSQHGSETSLAKEIVLRLCGVAIIVLLTIEDINCSRLANRFAVAVVLIVRMFKRNLLSCFVLVSPYIVGTLYTTSHLSG